MYVLRVNLFELITFYVAMACEMVSFVAIVVFAMVHGLYHLWDLYRAMSATKKLIGNRCQDAFSETQVTRLPIFQLTPDHTIQRQANSAKGRRRGK